MLALAVPAAVAAAVADPRAAGAAAGRDWVPFVMVTGLLLVGLVAGADGLFEWAGGWVADRAPDGRSLYLGCAALVAVVAAVLNLDTAVVFLTPVLLVAARRRGLSDEPFLYLAVFMANGASLLLPGSNLTNLIVVSGRHDSGDSFAARMWPAWMAACVMVALVVGLAHRRALRPPLAARRRRGSPGPLPRTAAALTVAAGLVVAVIPPAVAAPVLLGLGLGAAGARVVRRRLALRAIAGTVDAAVFAGLFGLAVALGALGSAWTGAQRLLAHAHLVGAAAIGALLSVVVNNLPAASLLGARPPSQPFALLVGLDLGPNLAVTGALSAVLWLQAAREAGARPSARRYTALGLVTVPLSMAAALAGLAVPH